MNSFFNKKYNENNKYNFKISERDYGKANELTEYMSKLILKDERKRKEKEINNYVYYFIKTNYTKIDIINAFESYESFEKFMKEVEYKLSQDEGFKKIYYEIK